MLKTNWNKGILIVLFLMFAGANMAYLPSVPGLMGDEASEGENVWMLIDGKQITIRGERSYIGPLIDYIRFPFVFVFGYTALSLRMVFLLFSLATFPLVVIVCRRLWGDEIGLIASIAMLFSPIYLLYQRLGWAISLFPFLIWLMLYLITVPKESRLNRQVPLLVGLVAGLGMHNHALFFPTMLAVVAGWLVMHLWQRKFGEIFAWWPAIVGFWAGFGSQFAVMLLNKRDFDDVLGSSNLWAERVVELRQVLPMVVSGSSYVARYTGTELSPEITYAIFLTLVGLVIVALVGPIKRINSWLWLGGLTVLITVLMNFILYFNLRYLATFSLGVWVLAGVGLGTLLKWMINKFWGQKLTNIAALGLAALLIAWTGHTTLLPWLSTGGQTNDFSIGNNTDQAAALVDTRPLADCLMGGEPVYSSNVHIHNRLRYMSYNKNSDLDVVAENESKKRAVWIVSYRLAGEANPHSEFEKCPELINWQVIARDRG